MRRTRQIPEWMHVFHNFAQTPYVLQAQLDELKQSFAASAATNAEASAVDSDVNSSSECQTRRERTTRRQTGTAKPGQSSARHTRGTPIAGTHSDRTTDLRHAATNIQDTPESAINSPRRPLYATVRQSGYATSVLDAYRWEPTEIERFRGILRVNTADGAYALKRTHISGQRVAFLQHLMRYASDRKFHQFVDFELSKKGRPYAICQDQVYYATRWIDGQQANFSSPQQARLAAQTLARFHEATRGFSPSGFQPKPEFNLARLLRDRRGDLRALVAQAEHKRSTDPFDETLLDLSESLSSDADDSLEHVEQSSCQSFLNDDQQNPGVCHLDVIAPNVIYDTDKRMVLLDLDLATYAPRVLDLSHLLRRCLQQSYWDGAMAYACFVEYNAVQPMQQAEYRLVLALLRFPHRAWRLARAHYRSGSDSLQLDELRSYRAQEEKRQTFLSELEDEISKVKT